MRKFSSLIFIYFLFSYLLLGIAFANLEFSVSGMVKDGISKQPISDAKVYLSIQSYSSGDKQQVEYSTQTITDAEGKYQFTFPIDTTKLNRNQTIRMLAAAKGYIGTTDYDMGSVNNTGFNRKHNFGLLPEGKEATVKGTIRDAVTRTPLSNIPIELSLYDSNNRTEMRQQWKQETRNLTSDIQGHYLALIPSKYVDRINTSSHWRLEIKSPDYDIAAFDPNGTGRYLSRDTISPDAEQEMNIAMNVSDYYLVSKTATGKLEGTLLDANNKPSSQTNLRIEILPAGAIMNRAGIRAQTDQGYMDTRIADFAKELNTDKTGKFSCAIPLKYIYQTKYALTITATIAGNPVKQTYTKLCIPGESQREFKQKLDNGYILKLMFTAK